MGEKVAYNEVVGNISTFIYDRQYVMAKKRPWWKVRRIWGAIFGGAAIVIATLPGAPVIATIGAISITTITVSTILGLIGTSVFGYGQGAKTKRNEE